MSTLRQKFLAFRIYRHRDTAAYGQLYDMNAERIRRFLVFKVPRQEDADELTSEVFLRGWEYMTTSHVDNATALLFRIARNLVADFYRKYHPNEGIEFAETVPSAESLHDAVAIKLAGDDLIARLTLIKAEYRDVLVMRYLSEMNVGEIASALEKTPNSVRVLLHRAKKALRAVSQGEDEGLPH